MPKSPAGVQSPDRDELSRQETKSLTHGEFWIPEAEREVYREALETLNRAGVRYIVSGLYALYEHTGIYRKTKDLDLFFEPEHVIPAARALREVGFHTRLAQAHWVGKAEKENGLVDLIFGMGNGLHPIDESWYEHSRPGILAATPVRIAPPEELIWHRLFISERHRSDMADVAHLILARGDELDWNRLLERVDAHWRLLLAEIQLFDYVYPGHTGRVPPWLRDELHERAAAERDEGGATEAFRGSLVSRFSFAIDVNEWGFRDLRAEAIEAARRLPAIREIAQSDVWDERPASDDGDD